MVKSRRKGYDVRTTPTDTQSALFAQDVVRLLVKKGFCIIDDGGAYDSKMAELTELLSAASAVFQPTPSELLGGLLGQEGSAKHVKCMPEESPEIIKQIDEQMGDYAAQISDRAGEVMGFELVSRTTGFLMESGMVGGGTSSEFTDMQEADEWLQWLEWARFMVLFVAGPDKATLELKPFDEDAEEISVNVEPGMWIIIRCDALSHVLKPKGTRCFTFGTFVLENNMIGPTERTKPPFPHTPTAAKLYSAVLDFMRKTKETAPEDLFEEQIGSREMMMQANRNFIRGDQICIRGAACRLPCAGPPEHVYKPLNCGIDYTENINPMRWDHMPYFCPEPENCLKQGKTYAQHCAWVDGIEFFDNKFFGISQAEAHAMDPHQCCILEIGYEAWHVAGYTKKSMMRQRFGVFVGSVNAEWTLIPCDGGCFGGTSASLAINSNRMSFQLGLMGPSFSIELEGAASLVATVQCADACQPGKVQQEAGIAMGADLALAPQSMALYSYPGWNSLRGRCFTFDESADGHVRSEGVAGIVMDPLMTVIDGQSVISQEDKVLALISSARSGSCGKTASYGSPNGIAEQELLAMTIRGANVSPLDVDAVECNGKGAILHDAVELAAIQKCYRSDPTQEMLGLCSTKTNYGHGMRVAGIVSVFKAIGNLQMGVQSPHNHLSVLNPSMPDEDDSATFITTEAISNRALTSFLGCSAKGYNGALAHVIFTGHANMSRTVSEASAKPPEEITYWPGGGGIMKAESRPNRAYTIVGSWNHWEPEAMELQGRGIYQKLVVLGSSGYERFQIWLDGNKAKTLHPSAAIGDKDTMVYGPVPDSESWGSCWQLDGRDNMLFVPTPEAESEGAEQVVPADQVKMAPSNDQAQPGDVFEVKLEVTGKYRTVTWEKVVEESTEGELIAKKEPVPATSYAVAGTFTKWSLQEMTKDPDMEGLYHVDITLRSQGAEFQIVVNGDYRLAFYPAYDGSTLGPDELGIGNNFFMDGGVGDSFRISLSVANGDNPSSSVYWEKTGSQAPSMERKGFYVVGDWDHFAQPIPLEFKQTPARYVFRRPYPEVGTESFQLLLGGERRFQVYPNKPDANPYEYHVLRGPNSAGWNQFWTVGKHENDKMLQGEDYEVTVLVSIHDLSQLATKLSWNKVQAEIDR